MFIALTAIYLIVTIAMTVWVANTLHHNGRVFLMDAFGGKDEMADSVNQLLKVGFYLVNVGFVLLFLNTGDTSPNTVNDVIRYLTTKLGVVLLVLGGMHFFNMFNISKMRSKGLQKEVERKFYLGGATRTNTEVGA